MNLNRYKWVLGSGCSYGAIVRSTFSPLDLVHSYDFKFITDKNPLPRNIHDTNDYIISINVPLSSHGAEWQSDSIIYLTEFLSNQGVLPENIYCIVEWSEWFRTEEHLTDLMDLDYNDFDFQPFTELYHDVRIIASNHGIPERVNHKEILDILNKIEISTCEGGASFGSIGKNVYMSVFCSDYHHIEEGMGIKYAEWLKELQEVNVKITDEKKIKRYFDCILKTQWFLKSKNINYNFFNMNSSLHNWFKRDGRIYHKQTDSVYNEKYHNIEEIFPQFKYMMDQIDFSNFWFYESDKTKRGGVDEWVYESFNESGYSFLNEPEFKNKELLENDESMLIRIPNYGNHPHELFYILLWNEIATNCHFIRVSDGLKDWILNMFVNDYNSPNHTENGFVLSKKFMEKYIK